MTLSRSRLIIFGVIYLIVMCGSAALLAVVIPAARRPSIPTPNMPTPSSKPLPSAATATAVPSRPGATRRPTVTAMPTLTATPQPTCHVVQWGETLWSLAERYGVAVEDLERANGIRWPDLIFPGQCLKLP